VTDDQLLWAAIGAGLAGLLLAFYILASPHLLWRLQQLTFRRHHARRMGLIRSWLP
jgi:hypothetical protein